MDSAAALHLITQHGIHGLGGSDGCQCTSFEIQSISVDVSCRKSEHCVRVHSTHLDRDPREMETIMREVIRQLEGGDYPETGYRIRFCDHADDNTNGRRVQGVWVVDHRCAYCGSPRLDRDGYLCDDCLNYNKLARTFYPWKKDGFLDPPLVVAVPV